MNPKTPDSAIILLTHFICQSASDIQKKKLKRLESDPQTPQAEILNVAFKVFSYQEEQQKSDLEQWDKAKFEMLAQALCQGQIPQPSGPIYWPKPRGPPGPVLDVSKRETLDTSLPQALSPTWTKSKVQTGGPLGQIVLLLL